MKHISESQPVGGIVLCGGKSSRMGCPKLSLPFGSELLLQRVVRILGEVVSPIVVVAASDQQVPDLPHGVRVLRDEQEFLGPLAGLCLGLRHLASEEVLAAYVSSCDAPLVQAAFVREMIRRLGPHELAVPREQQFHHPLAAVYRTSLADRANSLVAEGRLRPLFLIQQSDSIEISIDELRSADPELQSLRNVNSLEEYQEALRLAGLI